MPQSPASFLSFWILAFFSCVSPFLSSVRDGIYDVSFVFHSETHCMACSDYFNDILVSVLSSVFFFLAEVFRCHLCTLIWRTDECVPFISALYSSSPSPIIFAVPFPFPLSSLLFLFLLLALRPLTLLPNIYSFISSSFCILGFYSFCSNHDVIRGEWFTFQVKCMELCVLITECSNHSHSLLITLFMSFSSLFRITITSPAILHDFVRWG